MLETARPLEVTMPRKTLKEWLIDQVASQRKWIEKCGGDLAGYIANYHEKHGRTLENTEAIYRADTEALAHLEERLADMRQRERPHHVH